MKLENAEMAGIIISRNRSVCVSFSFVRALGLYVIRWHFRYFRKLSSNEQSIIILTNSMGYRLFAGVEHISLSTQMTVVCGLPTQCKPSTADTLFLRDAIILSLCCVENLNGNGLTADTQILKVILIIISHRTV